MNTKNLFLSLAVVILFAVASQAFAVSTFVVGQGGTGTTSPSGILYGDNGATKVLKTAVIGSGLSWSGTTLSATGGGGSGNVATSSTETAGQLPYWTSTGATPATLGKVATTSVTCSGNTTCTAFTAIGASPITISSTGGGTGLSTTSPTASSNLLVYSSVGAGAAYGIATTTHAFSGPFTISGTIGTLVGGSNSTVTWNGLATTSSLTQGQLLYNTTGGNGVASVATTTLGPGTTGLTFSNSPVILGASASALGGTLVVANGGTGAVTLTGCLTGNGTGAITGSGTCNTSNASVSSVATNYSLTGGPITTTGTLAVATSSLYTGTANQLPYFNGTNTLGATSTLSTFIGGTGSSTALGGILAGNGFGAIKSAVIGANLTWDGTTLSASGGGGTYPFPTATNGTTTLVQFYGNASTTQFTATSSAYLATLGGRVGIGTTIPSRLLEITGDLSGGIMTINRTPAGATNAVYGTQIIKATHDGDMGDGFGVAQQFAVQDNAGVENLIAGTRAYRNGADNSGNLDLTTYYLGNALVALTIDPLQRIGIGTSTPGFLLNIATGTKPQVSLSDGTLTSNSWTQRSISNNFYIATASPSTYATSTTAAFFINGADASTTLQRLTVGAVATSSFAGGINITSGCFSINNACVGGSGGGGSGTVTNVATNYSLTGGPITTTGTLSVATSSLYTGTTGQFPYFSGTNTITATSSLFLATSGNIGHGSTTPFAKLSIHANSTDAYNANLFAIGSSTASATTTLLSVGADGLITSRSAYSQATGGAVFDMYDSGGTRRTRLTSDGIQVWTFGTVAGNTISYTTPGGQPTIVVRDSGTDQVAIGTNSIKSDFALTLQAGTTGYLQLNSGGAVERIRVTSTGLTGFGSTTPWGLLSVNANAIGAGPEFVVGSSTATNLIVTNAGRVGVSTTSPLGTGLSTNGTNYMTGLTTSSGLQTGIMCLDANGQLINESVACVASAKRFKENIKPLDAGLDELMQLTPVSFTWKKDYLGGNVNDPNQNGVQYSLIADDVQKIDPHLVSLTTSTTTFEGTTYAPGTVSGLADTNHWVALIVSSIQTVVHHQSEQDKQIAELRAEIDALKGKQPLAMCSL